MHALAFRENIFTKGWKETRFLAPMDENAAKHCLELGQGMVLHAGFHPLISRKQGSESRDWLSSLKTLWVKWNDAFEAFGLTYD